MFRLCPKTQPVIIIITRGVNEIWAPPFTRWFERIDGFEGHARRDLGFFPLDLANFRGFLVIGDTVILLLPVSRGRSGGAC